ncbi:hypothetical protein ABZ901_22595 [Actinacidiphila alni]|uniref:hypothetical protein n=1 Tax=Actinacidiphila alni TaxID=380248 RepID=UPI0033FA6707
MGSVLRGLSRVPWGSLQDAQGPAGEIPALLSKVAWADGEAATAAVEELGERLCSLGFVVAEATAPAVPFLVELAGAPQVSSARELVELLHRIAVARQWSETAAAGGPGHAATYARQVGWEADVRAAVGAGRPVYEQLAAGGDPAVARAARQLLEVLDRQEESTR